ncbi:MAG: peptidase, partial [Gammaproteobacteria bacterium]|nr:peptidase [Gammaproteobacteria bacterium]NDE57320.1 peptidase [Gammaproteobacteria bacterium]NDG88573.1 peptidase [Gammaproteobacteria bacterium]
MTYCVAIKLKSGLVFASDSRTNAGIDQVSCFRKMRSFIEPGDRVIVTLCSGNLSITQNALNLLELQGRHSDRRNIWNVESMFDVAQLLGESLRQVRDTDGSFLAQSNVDSGANFLVGGQVGHERMRLFLVYAEGNFIEAGEETPFFQIGETKYGKPILDRVITPATPIAEAVKCVMVSFDSTMRSNLSVGLPIDLACYDTESLQLGFEHHITNQDPYFSQISRHWGEGL